MSDPAVDDDEIILLHLVDVRLFLIKEMEEAVAALKSCDAEAFSDALSDLWEKCEWAWGAWQAALEGLGDWRLQHRPDGEEDEET